MKRNPASLVTRRSFLKGGLALSGAATLGFSSMFGLRSAQAADGDDIPTILNVAATAETFACTHYYQAMTSKIRFTTAQLAYIKAALEQELLHLEYLNANGGKALADKFFFPQGAFKSAVSFGNVSAVAETAFVAAYLAATRRFAELGQPLLAATAAQVAGVEAQHLALVRQTANLLPNNVPLAEAKFWNVTEAVPVLMPVLDGKEGGLGPMEAQPVAFPGADVIRKAIGKSALTPTKPFTDLTPSAGAAATQAATQAGTQAAAPTQAATQSK